MARSGRGWDATPPRGRAARGRRRAPSPAEPLLWDDSEAAPSPPSEQDSGPTNAARRKAEMLASLEALAQRMDVSPADHQVPQQTDVSAAGREASRRREGSAADRRTVPRRDEPRREQPARDPQEVARDICLRQLAVRPRTRAELAKALSKRGIDDDVARSVLDRYSEVGMIDDAAFAKAWVSTRHQGRGLASRALAQELRQRGVSQEDSEQALSDLDPDTEAQTALDLATRKLRSMRGEPEAIFRRLVGMLARKGYPAGVAVRAVKEALATRDAELAEVIDPDAYEAEE